MSKKTDSENFQPTFKNLERDIERYLLEFGKRDTVGSTPVVRGYDEVKELMFDLYLKEKALSAIAHYLTSAWNWNDGVSDIFLQGSKLFQQFGQLHHLKRIWHAAIAVQKQGYWELRAIEREVDAKSSLSKAQSVALEHMILYRDILEMVGDEDEGGRIDEKISLLEGGGGETQSEIQAERAEN